MADQEWDESASKLGAKSEEEWGEQSGNRVVNIVKHVWSRVYLNIYDGGDFTEPSELTLKAALMEFALPTTKRKIQRQIEGREKIDWWSHWLGAGHSELSKPKAALIILIDTVFFLPRLAINILKLVTEVLPDMIAQLLFWANKKAKEGLEAAEGLRPSTIGYALAVGLTTVGLAIFKSLYFIGCCITSPIATSIRAGKFNYQNGVLNNFASFFSHFGTPIVSFGCYMLMLILLANAIPGLGFVLTISALAFAGLMLAYIAVDHLLSSLNRGPNGDNLIDLPGGDDGRVRDKFRYTDRDINHKNAKDFSRESTGSEARIYAEVEAEIQETLKYEHSNSYRPMFGQVREREDKTNLDQQSSTQSFVPTLTGNNSDK